MNETAIVFVAEFLRKLRSRAFIVATVGGAFAISVLTLLPSLAMQFGRSTTDAVVLAGPPALRARATALLERHRDFRIVAQVDALPAKMDLAYLNAHSKAAAALAVSVRAGRLHLDVYPRDLGAFGDVRFTDLIPLGVEIATGAPAAEAADAATVDRTLHPLDARFTNEHSANFARAIAFGLVFLLYFAIILASQSILSSVAEEKTNRIAEILVATISPTNLLTGKILAATVLAIVQLAVWVSCAIATAPASVMTMTRPEDALGRGSEAAAAAAASSVALIDPGVLVAFAVFFLLGYLQFATLYAAAGSLVTRTEDLGMVTTPLILPVVAAFLIAQYAIIGPNAPISVAFSFVPFVSPFVMFTRIAIATVPAWQIALSALINAVTVVVCCFLAGRIYRAGMLLYGKMPTPRQLWRVLRA